MSIQRLFFYRFAYTAIANKGKKDNSKPSANYPIASFRRTPTDMHRNVTMEKEQFITIGDYYISRY